LAPWFITGASAGDSSGIAAYASASAVFDFATLWTALIAFLLAAQQCRRIFYFHSWMYHFECFGVFGNSQSALHVIELQFSCLKGLIPFSSL